MFKVCQNWRDIGETKIFLLRVPRKILQGLKKKKKSPLHNMSVRIGWVVLKEQTAPIFWWLEEQMFSSCSFHMLALVRFSREIETVMYYVYIMEDEKSHDLLSVS